MIDPHADPRTEDTLAYELLSAGRLRSTGGMYPKLEAA